MMPATVAELARVIRVARGDEPADLTLRGGRVLNVYTGELVRADVAICGSWIAGVGAYGDGHTTIHLAGAVVLPGFIDGHFHIESTMLSPLSLGRAVALHGTTTIVADPHEIANVAGVAGVRYMLEAARGGPVEILLTAPSCVPATHLETSGARLGPDEVEEILRWPGVVGLGEMMNFPGVVGADGGVLRKLAAGQLIDGHAPGLSGAQLTAYAAAGPRSEHEATTLAEAQEKLSLGMYIMIREGSTAHNLADLAPLLSGEGARRCLLVSDDRNPVDLLEHGHVDATLRRAVAAGVPIHRAVQAVTLNAAEYFRLHDRGAVAPGLRADIAVVEDLERFEVRLTLKSGRLWGEIAEATTEAPAAVCRSVHVADINADNLAVAAPTGAKKVRVRVIEVIPGQLLTGAGEAELAVVDGCVAAAPSRDILGLAVIERHHASGRIGLGFVRGLGLRRGAIASTVAHDSHNLVVAGATPQAMLTAARAVIDMGGGQAVAVEDQVLAVLPLPIAGLMSDRPVEEVAAGVRRLQSAARGLGCTLPDPAMALSFLALPVIPRLKLTDRGLVDVEAFDFVPVLV